MKSPLALHEALLQAQVPPIAAEKAASALEQDMSTVLATKQDLQHFGELIRRDIADLRGEFKSDINALRTELKGDLNDLRTETQTGLLILRHDMVRGDDQLRHEMQQGFASIHNDMARLGNTLLIKLSGVMVAVAGLAATLQHLLLRGG